MTDAKEPESKTDRHSREAVSSTVEVVVVDDSRAIRERVVASLMEVKGIGTIRQADSAPAGLRLLAAHRPDVLVLDIEMPGKSGIDLLPIAKSWGFASVIIMLSIHDEPRMRKQCMDLGADYYFHKVTEFERVAEVCRELAEKRRQAAGL